MAADTTPHPTLSPPPRGRVVGAVGDRARDSLQLPTSRSGSMSSSSSPPLEPAAPGAPRDQNESGGFEPEAEAAATAHEQAVLADQGGKLPASQVSCCRWRCGCWWRCCCWCC